LRVGVLLAFAFFEILLLYIRKRREKKREIIDEEVAFPQVSRLEDKFEAESVVAGLLELFNKGK